MSPTPSFSTRGEILSHLFSLHARGIKYDLEKITRSSEDLANPWAAYDCIHVAGTNGKGSTCAYLDAALRAAGVRTGLYTSPHLIDFEERFAVEGKIIATEQWLGVYRDIAQLVDRYELTFFEATTLMAFELFKREKVSWAVFETGLGGRLDATNVVTPRVSVITSLAMDHREYLGDTLEQVAGEKLGIVKKGVPLVMARPEDRGVRELARTTCELKGAPLTFVDISLVDNLAMDKGFARFSYRGQDIRLPLPGRYQVENALCALVAFEQAGIEIDAHVAEALRQVRVPGRFQEIAHRGKTLVLDVAHNPSAAALLSYTIAQRFEPGSVCAVMGIMKDKDSDAILEEICKVASEVICTRPDTPRAEQASVLSGFVSKHGVRARVVNEVAVAVNDALESTYPVVLVAGSFFTVGEAMQSIRQRPFQ